MTEEEYQFGIRELPPVKLIAIINAYRDELRGYQRFFEDEELNRMIRDYKYVLDK